MVSDETKALCKYCKCEIRVHHGDLLPHADTAKHKKNSPICSSMQLTDMGVTRVVRSANVKHEKLKNACFIAHHCAVSAVDHLGEMVADMHNNEIQLHRTKCTALICNVLAPCFLKEMVEDLNKVAYSLIIDESTDISCTKQLCVMVRYFSVSLHKIITTFLGLTDLEGETSNANVSALLGFLRTCDIDFQRCIGVGTDGCSVMVGNHYSVYRKLKEVNPNLQLVKCVCHLLQLCASKAVQMLPRYLEFLVGRSYSWLSRSVKHQRNYAILYKTINDGQDPLRLVLLSNTRWLSMYKCCERVLAQWDELKLHFGLCKSMERCYDAELLSDMYENCINKLYLEFLTPILQDFNRVNKLFQLESGNHLIVLDNLLVLFRSLVSRVVIPACVAQSHDDLLSMNLNDTSIFLPIDAVDFGTLLNISFQRLNLHSQTIQDVKKRCMGFIIEASKQILLRLPENIRLWKSLSLLSPTAVLSQVKQPLAKMEFIKLHKGDLGLLDIQYRSVHLSQWHANRTSTAENFWVCLQPH